jgi:hypothetical protein
MVGEGAMVGEGHSDTVLIKEKQDAMNEGAMVGDGHSDTVFIKEKQDAMRCG